MAAPNPTPIPVCTSISPSTVNLGYDGEIAITVSGLSTGYYRLILPDGTQTGRVWGETGDENISFYLKQSPSCNVCTPPVLNTSGTIQLLDDDPWQAILCAGQITVLQVIATPTPVITIIPPPIGTCNLSPNPMNKNYSGILTIVAAGIQKGKSYNIGLPYGTIWGVMAEEDQILRVSLQNNGQNFSGSVSISGVCESNLEILDPSKPSPTPTPRDYTCLKINGRDDEINTAIGCIPVEDLNEFSGWVLGKLIFVITGVAFLLLVFGAFQIITSSGDPKKTQAAKELITAAVSGLLFIILSVLLLKLIGVDILQIPEFGN